MNLDNELKNQKPIIHFFKKIGFLFLLLLLPTLFFSWYYKNDKSYSIIFGDSSDFKILVIHFGLCLCFLIFLIIEAIKFNRKKLYKLRNANLFAIPFILVIWFAILVIEGKIIPYYL
jgi:hypothetical protein